MSRRKQSLPLDPVTVRVASLSPEGRGVAQVNGKAVFIDGALPGEEVRFKYLRRRERRDEGKAVEVLEPHPRRVVPECPYFGVCGGCSMQHLAADAQIEHKQAALLAQLERIGGVRPESVLAPITGPLRGYRRKARLAVRFVEQKGGALVGFREKHSNKVADISDCRVLHPAASRLLPALRALISELSVRRQVPQIEVAVDGAEQVALVVRHLAPLTEADRASLEDFARTAGVHLYLQPAGPETAAPLAAEDDGLQMGYRLEVQGGTVEVFFQPTDFTQVNLEINARMVTKVCGWLEPQPGDRILDLYCGLGNFTLPLARAAGRATGVDGDAALIARARANARHNRINNADFVVADLADAGLQAGFLAGHYDKVVLDPPRSGSAAILKRFDWRGVRQVAYVSCNPATLARDAGILVREHGYRLEAAGVIDMFPHTAHVESLALFRRAV
jgi:23S rRNA (uracil1939-C5)-methyltransferase